MIGHNSAVMRSVTVWHFPGITYKDTFLDTFTSEIPMFCPIDIMQLKRTVWLKWIATFQPNT